MAKHASLVGPPETLRALQTVRIPLTAFGASTLNAIRGVRLTFSGMGSGEILLANIRATSPAIDAATTGLHGNGDPAPVVNTLIPLQ